jgi:hypothetical protein
MKEMTIGRPDDTQRAVEQTPVRTASTAVSFHELLGALRLNLTQPECSDGGLNG